MWMQNQRFLQTVSRGCKASVAGLYKHLTEFSWMSSSSQLQPSLCRTEVGREMRGFASGPCWAAATLRWLDASDGSVVALTSDNKSIKRLFLFALSSERVSHQPDFTEAVKMHRLSSTLVLLLTLFTTPRGKITAECQNKQSASFCWAWGWHQMCNQNNINGKWSFSIF